MHEVAPVHVWQFYLAIAMFFLSYVMIALEKINKTLVVLFGASFIVLFHVLPSEVALRAIDLNVIFLLISVMIIVHILAESGFFQWLAINVFHLSRGKPIVVMILLSLATAVTSAFLDNVTTVLLMAPVTIVLVQYLELDPVPFLISEIISSNIGGTATLIGDPPNILIGLQAHLAFNDFIFNLMPVVLIIEVCFIITIALVFKKSFSITQDVTARIAELDAREAIKDKGMLIKGLVVLGCVIVALMFHSALHIDISMVALCGATVLMIITKYNPEKAFRGGVEWATIFFFIGLFILVDGLVYVGAIKILASHMLSLTKGNMAATTFLVLWFSAIASAIVDNIPFVATMIPLIKTIGPHIAGQMHVPVDVIIMPLWWALALGACLGGNGSLIGASANLIVAGIALKSGYKISFVRFLKYGLPLMVQSLIICSVYIYVRYLMVHHY